jgi:hypothetical protein
MSPRRLILVLQRVGMLALMSVGALACASCGAPSDTGAPVRSTVTTPAQAPAAFCRSATDMPAVCGAVYALRAIASTVADCLAPLRTPLRRRGCETARERGGAPA